MNNTPNTEKIIKTDNRLTHRSKAYFTSLLDELFEKNEPEEAHQKAIPLLKKMVNDPQVLHEALAEALSSDSFFSNSRNGPVIGFNFQTRQHYCLRINCFFPLPDRSNNISHNWIHHHESRILTTINAFGDEGYNSIEFHKNISHDPLSNHVKLTIKKEFTHKRYNIEHIPPFVPHVVFIPPSLTITYALWSRNSKIAKVLRHPKLQQISKASLKKLIHRLGAKKLVDRILVNKHFHLRQFAPNDTYFTSVGEVLYSPSTNANYVQNTFYILQQVEFNNPYLLQTLQKKAMRLGRLDVVHLVNKYQRNETINDCYDLAHIETPNINFTREAVIKVAC
jgi:hypothetical protein